MRGVCHSGQAKRDPESRRKKNWIPAFAGMTALACVGLTSCLSSPAYVLMGINETGSRKRLESYAEKGDVYSQYELGRSWCCGVDQFHDTKKAVHWLCKAAKNGHGPAQLLLGRIYDDGSDIKEDIIPKDNAKAFVWYSVAERRAMADASAARKKLGPRLSAEQIGQSDVMLKDWRKISCAE